MKWQKYNTLFLSFLFLLFLSGVTVRPSTVFAQALVDHDANCWGESAGSGWSGNTPANIFDIFNIAHEVSAPNFPPPPPGPYEHFMGWCTLAAGNGTNSASFWPPTPNALSLSSANRGTAARAYFHCVTYDVKQGKDVPVQCQDLSKIDMNQYGCIFNWADDLSTSCLPRDRTDVSGIQINATMNPLNSQHFFDDPITQSDMINAITDFIGVHNTFPPVTINVGGDSYTASVPATNCVKLSGNGPRKVVFMRGKSWNSSVSDFLAQANNIVNSGFKTIEPFRTYADRFSFYVDLKKYDDTLHLTDNAYDYAAGAIENGSSCDGVDGINSNNSYYFLYFNKDTVDEAAWIPNVPAPQNIAFMNLSPYGIANYSNTPRVAIHEMGHVVGRLTDEYWKGNIDSLYDFLLPHGQNTKNCSVFPYRDYHNRENNKVYGSINTPGCTFLGYANLQYLPKGSIPPLYYRPSRDDMMKEGAPPEWNMFNVISCGYVMAGIFGEDLSTKKYAQKHWSECNDMAIRGAVIRDGIPPVNPTPTSIVLLINRVSPGFPVTVSGSNFTNTNNAAQFTNTTTGNFYETLGIPNTNGATLTFSVPLDAPPGNYTLKVGAFNSDWSNSVPFTVASVRSPVISLAATRLSVPLGEPVTLIWSTQGATTCTKDVATIIYKDDKDKYKYKPPKYKPPESWINNTDFSGSLTFSLTDSATFYLTCTGPGGKVSKSVGINGAAPLPPTVSITATASNVVVGSGITIAWSTTRASSCRGSGTGDNVTLSAWNKAQPLTGSLYLTPTANVSLILSCSGPGGTKSNNFPISVVSAVSPPPLLTPTTPTILTLTPASGPLNTRITLNGTANDYRGNPYNPTGGLVDTSNFNSDTLVIITGKTSTDIVKPVFTPVSNVLTDPSSSKTASLTFTFSPTFIEIGDYTIKASNGGVLSNAVTFSNTTPTAPPVNEKLLPPVLKLQMSFFQEFVASVLNGFNLLFGR